MSQTPANQQTATNQTPANSTPSTQSQQQATPPAQASSNQTPAAAAAASTDENFLGDSTPVDQGNKPDDSSFASASEVEEIEYDLELPDDSLVPDEDFDELVNEAKEKGLSKDEAEARLKLLNKAFTKAKETYLKSEGKRLMDELVKDPMFSTKELQVEAKKNIDAVYAAYKDPDFMKFVKSNPLIGNNVHFVKFMAKLGKSLAPEKAPITDGGNPSTPQTGDNKSVYETMYPDMFPKK